MINLNSIHLTGKELTYINEAFLSGKISGNGMFTKRCQTFFENKYNFGKVLLTPSCTSALEMAAILLEIKEGDEIIAPSYTFMSTVNPFLMRGAKIVFADSGENNPNIDADRIEELITDKTKIIIPVHYAGIACDMNKIMLLAKKYNLFVVEDAAHSIDSYYMNKPLGSIGHLSAFSFHESKNLVCGEGGMLVINDKQFVPRAEIIREMGTNRASFFRGEVNKYGWMDIGSSFLLPEISAAFLLAQIEDLENIQNTRKKKWELYYNGLEELQITGQIGLPQIPHYAYNNAHMFYIRCKSLEERTSLIKYLKINEINAAFHYLSLHNSPFYLKKHDGRHLELSDLYTDTLLRLPLYVGLTDENIAYIVNLIVSFYQNDKSLSK